MGGWYPASRPSRPSFNFFGSGAPQRAARVVNTWPTRRSDGIANESGIGTSAELVFLGDEVGEAVKTGAKLMRDGPPGDPVRAAYEAYLGGCSCSRDGSGGGRGGRESWDPLTVLYVLTADDSEDEGARLFEQGAAYGYNVVDARDGSNAWVWDEDVTNQSFLRLRVDNETAAAAIDRRMLDGAWRAHEVAAATIARAAQRSRENSTGGYMDEL